VKKKLGFIVNPVAGMGGRVGLKGTDGADILQRAREMGAIPLAPQRAATALRQLLALRDSLEVVTCPGSMGEDLVRELGFSFTLTGRAGAGETSGTDTESGAARMRQLGVDLLLFAGGDGTARNIYHAVGSGVPVLGIPAGVKIHSAVFAASPAGAGVLAGLFLREEAADLAEAEVMDIDEEAFRRGRVSARLYGYLQVPSDRRYMQHLKVGGDGGGEEAVAAIAHRVVAEMEEDCLYLVGPGTTTRAVMEALNLPCTLLGVDVVLNRNLLAADAGEGQLLEILKEGRRKALIIVTIIGGQGYIFGRGNQQFSPEVIKKVGLDHIVVIASRGKLLSLHGEPLRVDTGDEGLDRELSGYIRVLTGERESSICRVTH
jgi:predicted polyphosphate/ATP-dependent NAD kinase